jgi:alpha,alpha-trehalase
MTGWSLIYEGFKPEEEGLREALCTLGNGYFATRGAGPETEAGDVHYPGTYLAGGYNRLSTEIAGRVVENEDLVNLPNWLILRFRTPGREWFTPAQENILSYRQELDIRKGLLIRTFRFQDGEGKTTKVASRRLVHMARPHLAALETRFTAENWSGRLEIHSGLDGRVVNAGVERYQGLNNHHLEPVEAKEIAPDTIFLKVETNQSELRVAQAARTRIGQDSQDRVRERELIQGPAYVGQEFAVDLQEGEEVVVEKVLAMFTSRDHAISECSLEARQEVERAGSFEDLVESHTLVWEHIWRHFQIDFDSTGSQTDYMTMVLHLYLFHLLQSTSVHTMDLDVGVPSRGWHGEAYRGHVFWDELFIFPLLNLRFPEITRSLLMYRYRRLGAARVAAKEAGFAGALYPWQSGSNGREESQEVHLNPRSGRWLPDSSHLQRHVNAAIAYNIWQYFQVTADMEFLSFYGAEMFLEIARLWGSMATFNAQKDRYEILGVVGPDEFQEGYPGADEPGLNNHAYTNIMAVWVLSRAKELLDLLPADRSRELRESLDLRQEELDLWQDVAHKMLVVFHDDGIISQFEGYGELEELDWEHYRNKYGDIQRLDRILEAEGETANRYKASKQADVLMLFYVFSAEELGALFDQLGYPFADDTIPKNIDYYLKRTSHGSTLSRVVHSWVLIRSDRIRSWSLFKEALKSDVADIQGGTTPEGIHLGAMAGTVDLVQRGYAGIETRGHVLRFSPALPKELAKLRLQLRYRGQSLEASVTADKLTLTACRCAEEPIKVACKERFFDLEEGKTIEIDLEA